MSIEEGEMAFPERGYDVGWDGQTGPDSWARTWTCRGCEEQWGGAAHLKVGELGRPRCWRREGPSLGARRPGCYT